MENSVDNGYNIYHHLHVKASPKTVYEAITLPEHLNNWWPLKSTGKPNIGTEYNFYFGDDYDWYAEVIQSVLNESFHVKMTQADEDWNPTRFGFDLQENGGETELTFQHMNWPACNTHFKTASYCWAILLKDLKNYIENGAIVPFEERS